MSNYNRVILMGNITRDIELKYTANKTAIAQVGMAVNHRYKTKDGESKEDVTFVDCDAWGKTAEVMQKHLRKGEPVLIEGRLKLDQWQDKDGSNRSKLKVVIESFEFVGGKRESAAETQASSEPAGISQDDIPFTPDFPMCYI